MHRCSFNCRPEAFVRQAIQSARAHEVLRVGEYVIGYRVRNSNVIILRVVRKRRDIEAWFGN